MDYQKFVCSMGLNFVGNWFTTLKHRTIHDFGKRSWGVNLWVRVTHEINEHRSPKNNNDSTAIHISVPQKA